MADTDTGKSTPIGGNVVRAVEELRAARGLSLRQLSEALGATGHPLFTSAVHALVQGKRRADVDDLVALAVVLGVNPNALLLPRHAGREELVELTPAVEQRSYVIWGWLDGFYPLPGKIPPLGALAVNTPGDKFADWVAHARPDHAAPEPHPAVAELITLKRMLDTVLADPDNTELYANWRDVIIRRFRLVAIQFEELLAEFDRKAMASSAFDSDWRERAAVGDEVREAVREVRSPAAAAATAVNPLDPFGERDQ